MSGKTKKRTGLKSGSLPARAGKVSAGDAWWYEDRRSISVYINLKTGGVVSAQISRGLLASWLKRTEPKKPKTRKSK